MDPVPPSPAPDKKGLLPLVIAGIICAGGAIVLVVFGTILVMVGKFAVSGLVTHMTTAAHDQQEEPASGTPASPAAAADEGSATPDATPPESEATAPPPWVPVYPNLLKPARDLRREEKGVVSGTTTFETDDPLDKVKAFYQSKLKTSGFEMTVDRTATRLFEDVQITAKKEGGKLAFHAAIRRGKERTTVTLSYEDAEQAEAATAAPRAAVSP